ncbi:hypothetical protein RQP46_010914 [Phenoliferia psychrophenolica]
MLAPTPPPPADRHLLAKYGLATQLRSPALDNSAATFASSSSTPASTPSSSSIPKRVAPVAPPEHRAATTKNRLYTSSGRGGTGAIKDKLDLATPPSPTLDLGIRMDSIYSTYQGAKSTPNLVIAPDSPRSEDIFDSTSAKLGVATRVSRGESIALGSVRKASIGTIIPAPSVSLSSSLSSSSGPTPPPHPPLTPPRRLSAERLLGMGPRNSSYTANQVPTIFRRNSSVFIPNPSSEPPPVVNISARGTTGIVLVTLAKRTSHISSTPGYGWRLHLLEKLEIIMGAFLTIGEAEEILSIGNGMESKPAPLIVNTSKANRKSLIGLPPTSPTRPKTKIPGSARSPSQDAKSGGFFRRVFGANDGTAPGGPNSKPPPPKIVFGVPLEVLAQYGFVTSMIAGKRHDLPGVCFSAVEEIYRRGQGTRIPGLLNMPGEPARLAKLVDVFNSAPDYGERHDLSIESIHNVTSLLKKYLRDLPEPILDGRLWRLYISACVDSTSSLKRRVACAQIILRLLPTPNFSLMVYLVAFLSQAPLFPENAIPLESVAQIFGASTMASRNRSAGRLQKLVSSHAINITGPTEHFDASGVSVKKAQDGLLWLLAHWSLVADGLLEPDFDLDTDEVLDRALPPLNIFAPAPLPKHHQPPSQALVNVLSPILGSPAFPPSTYFADTPRRATSPTPTLEIFGVPNPHSTPPLFSTPKLPTSPSLSIPRSPALQQTPSSTVYAASTVISSPKPSSSSPNPSSISTTPVLSSSSRSQRDSDPPFAAMLSTGAADPAADLPVSESEDSSRMSDSTLSSADTTPGDKKHSPPHLKAVPKFPLSATPGAKAQTGFGFARPAPEDEFGPLGPNSDSVLDELLDSSEDTSLYQFPSPPQSPTRLAPSHLPRPTPSGLTHSPLPLPPSSLSSPFPSLGSRSPNESLSNSLLIRTQAEQFLESQQLLESSRRDVQDLWAKLTVHEVAHAADKDELTRLRGEVSRLTEASRSADAVRASEWTEMGKLKAEAIAARNQRGELKRMREELLAMRQVEKEDWAELEQLRNEVGELRSASVRMDKTGSAGSATGRNEQVVARMEARCREAKRSLEETKEELRLVREEKEGGERDAQAQVANLKTQLDSIRSVLGSRI